MSNFKEPNLLVPTIIALGKNGGCISTTKLIEELTKLMQPSGEDLEINESRNDSKFSQKVRNMKAHDAFDNLGWAERTEDGWKLTASGQNFFNRLVSLNGNQNNIPTTTHQPLATNFTPTQIIYYGVPGTGKSFQVDAEINETICKYNKGKASDDLISYEKQVTRVVFHPDYGNADFIGQVMPKSRKGGIEYEFKPGPFSQILRKAYLNPNRPYFLVIEEINRGNAAAIFGDIFQSLDRLKGSESSEGERIRNEVYKYTAGWSKYGITNEEINGYILDIEKNPERDSDISYDSDDPENAPKAAIRIPALGMHFSINSQIRLPPNLSLYATMNTSDQNVFTLDNAFQRRWEMKQVPNKLASKIPEGTTAEQQEKLKAEVSQYNAYIGGSKEDGGTSVEWGVFRDEINKVIMRSAEQNGLSSMEDKRLGGWFIVPMKSDEKEGSTAIITKEAFAEKVLKYLWDDAFKFDRASHFGKVQTLEELVENFEKDGFNVFIDAEIKKLQRDSSITHDASAQNDTSVTNG